MGDISGHQKRVAVIGAGVSGVTSAKHLKDAGIDVVVFERSKCAGGNWVYDKRRPLEPTYPSLKASIADPWGSNDKSSSHYVNGNGACNGDKNKELTSQDELLFAPPGPAYKGLTNNVSTKCQQLRGFPWPDGTPDFVDVRAKENCIQSYARHFNIERLIRYNTRVERVEKVGNLWRVSSVTLLKDDCGRISMSDGVEDFDAVVVASGHYHASKVPDIPGLKEWKEAWPNRVEHSKGYRSPADFKDQTVLLVGAGVSSADIGRECSGIAKKIYQSSCGGVFDLPVSFLSADMERVAGIAAFNAPSKGQNTPGIVTLTDGRILTDIDRVLICAGYLFSLPFLSEYHDDTLQRFYIPDPTLLFIGVPAYTATFTFSEFQAIAAAAVLSDHAWLPSKEEMRKEYQGRVKQKGYGRAFHSLAGNQDEPYVDDLMRWLNEHAEVTGGRKFEPYDEEWRKEKKLVYEKLARFLEGRGKKAKGLGQNFEFGPGSRAVKAA